MSGQQRSCNRRGPRVPTDGSVEQRSGCDGFYARPQIKALLVLCWSLAKEVLTEETAVHHNDVVTTDTAVVVIEESNNNNIGNAS